LAEDQAEAQPPREPVMFVTAVVLSMVLLVVFAASGVQKVVGAKLMHDTAEHFRLSARTVQGIGALELAGSAGLLVGLSFAPLGIAAAAGLATLMVLAVIFHVRESDPPGRIAAPAVLGLIAAAAIFARAASF
jgi:hypothetical protein